jgi:hypothetical protein
MHRVVELRGDCLRQRIRARRRPLSECEARRQRNGGAEQAGARERYRPA